MRLFMFSLFIIAVSLFIAEGGLIVKKKIGAYLVGGYLLHKWAQSVHRHLHTGYSSLYPVHRNGDSYSGHHHHNHHQYVSKMQHFNEAFVDW